MKIKILRYNFDTESTQGIGAIDNDFAVFTLEDQRRPLGEEKVQGETAIPAKTYKLGIQEKVTPLTKHYRSKYPWFDKHIMILDVPDFDNVYIHIGNNDKHTDGCILVADLAVNDPSNYNGEQAKSVQAFHRFYSRVFDALKKGEEVTLEIGSVFT